MTRTTPARVGTGPAQTIECETISIRAFLAALWQVMYRHCTESSRARHLDLRRCVRESQTDVLLRHALSCPTGFWQRRRMSAEGVEDDGAA